MMLLQFGLVVKRFLGVFRKFFNSGANMKFKRIILELLFVPPLEK